MADVSSQRHLDGYIDTGIMLRALFYLEYKEYQAAQLLPHLHTVKGPKEGQRKHRKQRRSRSRSSSTTTKSRSSCTMEALRQTDHRNYDGRESEREIRLRMDQATPSWPVTGRRSPYRTTTCILNSIYTILVKTQL